MKSLSLKEGFEALNRGDTKTAAEACKMALSKEPNLVPAHFLVGLVSLQANELNTATKAFRSVIALDRDHAGAWSQLAKISVKDGRLAVAERALEEVRRLRPTNPKVIETVGETLNLLGDHEEAEKFFDLLNQQLPDNPSTLMHLGTVRVALGKIDDAVTLFRRAIELTPHRAGCHWGLANSVKAVDRSHIDQMKSLLSDKRLNKPDQASLNYAIGKEFEDLKEWDNAFEAFSAGAAIRRETVEFDEAQEIKTFELITSIFNASWLARCQPGASDNAPIFVLGQPRTGTTLLERVITSHSEVHAAGELQQFSRALRLSTKVNDPKRFSEKVFSAAANLDPSEIGNRYLKLTSKHRDKAPFFVDKLPVNYIHIPLILAALPNAKIVHLVRGPMDACFASFKQLFADAYLHSYDQGEMARHHARYRDLMAHFHQEFPERIIDVSYEETARNLEPNARRLIAALGLEWEDACLNFTENTSGVATASSVQVREPAHTRSIGRWRRYETQLAPMVTELKRLGVPLD